MNNKLIEAQVILARCQENKKLFGITVEKEDDRNWNLKYSYPIDENRAKSEGFDKTVIKADFKTDPDFKGCPSCGRRGFVRCGTCRKITCYSDEKTMKCGWCGTLLEDIAYRGAMDVSVGAD